MAISLICRHLHSCRPPPTPATGPHSYHSLRESWLFLGKKMPLNGAGCAGGGAGEMEKSGAKGSNASTMYLFITRKCKQTCGSSHPIVFFCLTCWCRPAFSLHAQQGPGVSFERMLFPNQGFSNLARISLTRKARQPSPQALGRRRPGGVDLALPASSQVGQMRRVCGGAQLALTPCLP